MIRSRPRRTAGLRVGAFLALYLCAALMPGSVAAVDPTHAGPSLAADASAEPDPSGEPSVEPTPAETPTPTPEASPTPEPSPTPEATPTPQPSPTPLPGPGATTDYIVSFVPGTSSDTQAAVLAAAGVEVTSSVSVLRMAFVAVTDNGDGADALAYVRAHSSVAKVDLDRVRAAEAAPSDPGYADQWSLPKIGWDRVFGNVSPSGSATVALLDTGVDGSNPDLAGSLVAGTSILDGSDGATDPNGHGTALAGIIAAATDNATGIAGIGYAGVKVMPVTVLDASGVGQDSDIIAGIVYAVGHGADVINMSFSSSGYSAALQAAIDYAWANDVVLVASVGNDSSAFPAYPAGDRGVIGVSNTDQNDALNPSSNTGEAVFLGAPGTDIVTTAVGGGTTSISGTSASSAEVAAAAALLLAIDPSASNGVIVNRLALNAANVGAQAETGNGRLDLATAASDTATDSVEPVGTGPGLGNGGPYLADSTSFNVTPLAQTVSAGSTNNYSWLFTAVNATASTTTTFTIPAGWTAPQVGAGAGNVTVVAGTCPATLLSVSLQVITIDQGPGSATCANGTTFTVNYNTATAPAPAAPPQTYSFVNQHGQDPNVTVNAFYFSAATGNWASASSWTVCADEAGTLNCTPATVAPTNTNSQGIVVRSPHTISVAAATTADQVTVNSGGTLVVNSGQTLTLANGTTGDDLTVDGTLTVAGTLAMGVSVSTNVTTAGTTTVNVGGAITGSGGAGTTRSVLTISSTTTSTIAGGVTGGLYGIDLAGLVSISGDISISNNSFITVTGNVSVTSAGSINMGGGTGSAYAINSGGVVDYADGSANNVAGANTTTVASNGRLTLRGTSYIYSASGTGAVTINAGGNLEIGSTDGINTTSGSGGTGNVRTAGTDSYSTAANYSYIGTAAQVTGAALPATVNNLTINNSAGVTLTASLFVTGVLALTSGDLLTGANAVFEGAAATTSGATDVVGKFVRTSPGTTSLTYGNPNNAIQNSDSLPSSSVGTLASLMNASTTTASVTETASPPGVPFVITIDSEQMIVTARTGASNPRTYTVARGVNGTTAASHSSGASVGVSQLGVTLAESAPSGKGDAVTRTYSISPTTVTGYTATVQLHYLDAELNGNTEGALHLWHLNGSWGDNDPTGASTTRDTSANWVKQTGIAAASFAGDWTLAQGANVAPVVTATVADLAYTENDGAVALDSGITVTDADSTNLASATVTMTTNYVNGQDVLAFSNQNGITGSWTASTGVLALTGSASVTNYQTALRSITYSNTSDAPSTATRTVTFVANDGTANSNTASRQITITSVNDVPSFTKGSDQGVLEDAAAQSVSGWATAISAGPSESSQVVDFIVSNDNNGLFSVQPAVGATGTLTYTLASNANGSTTVSVQIHDDGGTANGGVDTSAVQTFTITVTAVNDVPSFTKGSDQGVLEDAPAQSVTGWATAASKGPANEASQTLDFIVSNDNNGLFSVQPTVQLDCGVPPCTVGTLSYTPAANANGSATVSVQIHDDGGTANGGVDTSAVQTFTITVTAVNDVPSFTKGADQTVLEDSGIQNVVGWATAISAGPANESSQTLGFFVYTTESTLFYGQPNVSSDGTLTYTPETNANGTATVYLWIYDNGGTANGGVDESATQVFTITITAVNDEPSFTKGSNQSPVEDAGAQSVSGWATAISKGPANESGQTVDFIVSNDNNGLFSVQPVVSATGTLSYTPATNANGSATVSVQIHDNGGIDNGGDNTSAAQTFTISVKAVNDVPSFTKGADQTVRQEAPAQSVSGWATAISRGPADESGQLVDFIVSNDNNGLFSVQPAISATGTLSYTPATGVAGVATVTVQIHDDGGTADGGVDTSAAQTFVITVSDGAYISSSGWSTSFELSRYLKLTFPAYVPAGSTVTGATFRHEYRSTTAGDTTCYYFEVYSGAALLATHGSSGSPVSCNSTTSYASDAVALPEVNTDVKADNVIIKMFVKNSGGRSSTHRIATLGVTSSLD